MTGYCYDNNNKLVFLCYLSIILVIAFYYCGILPKFLYWFYLFLSVGDPGLPRYCKLRAFGIFHDFFSSFFKFDNENYYQCGFLYLYLLIKPFKVDVKVLHVHALTCLGL